MRITTITFLLGALLACPQTATDDTGAADTDTDTDSDTDVDTDTDTAPGGVLATCSHCVDLGGGVWRLPVFPEPTGIPWTQVYGNWVDDGTGGGGWALGSSPLGALSQAISDPLPLPTGSHMTSAEVEGNCLQISLETDPVLSTSTTATIWARYLAPETIDAYVLDIVIEDGVSYRAEAGAANNGLADPADCRFQRLDIIFEAP